MLGDFTNIDSIIKARAPAKSYPSEAASRTAPLATEHAPGRPSPFELDDNFNTWLRHSKRMLRIFYTRETWSHHLMEFLGTTAYVFAENAGAKCTMEFEELCSLLKIIFNTNCFTAANPAVFYERVQESHESPWQYAAALQTLSHTTLTRFPKELRDNEILHQFCAGSRPISVAKDLLYDPPKSLQEATERVVQLINVENEGQQLTRPTHLWKTPWKHSTMEQTLQHAE